VEISGNLVRDPELRFTPKGTSRCPFTIAQNMGKGEARRGHFFKCVAWKEVAEGIAEKYSKGKPRTKRAPKGARSSSWYSRPRCLKGFLWDVR